MYYVARLTALGRRRKVSAIDDSTWSSLTFHFRLKRTEKHKCINTACPPKVGYTLELPTSINAFFNQNLKVLNCLAFDINSAMAFLAISATAVTAKTLALHEKRDSCGQSDTISVSSYTTYNDHWNEASGTGYCIGVDYQSGNQISWHAVWT